MARYSAAEIIRFRRESRCEDCVHHAWGCPLFLALLRANHEDWGTPGLDLIVDMRRPCRMFYACPEETKDPGDPALEIPARITLEETPVSNLKT